MANWPSQMANCLESHRCAQRHSQVLQPIDQWCIHASTICTPAESIKMLAKKWKDSPRRALLTSDPLVVVMVLSAPIAKSARTM
eukprot:692370-Amphidinium_carterae.1